MPPRALTAAELLAVVDLWKRTGRTVEARLTGSSMEPAIPSGSLVRLRCGAPLQVGQVAAFVHDGHVTVHRLVARQSSRWLARGDALALPDAPLPIELPFARVEAVLSGDAWLESPTQVPSPRQRAVLALCTVAERISVGSARLLIAGLRRLQPRSAASIEVLE